MSVSVAGGTSLLLGDMGSSSAHRPVVINEVIPPLMIDTLLLHGGGLIIVALAIMIDINRAVSWTKSSPSLSISSVERGGYATTPRCALL